VSYPIVTLSNAGAGMRWALEALASYGDFQRIEQKLMSFAKIKVAVGRAVERAREQEFAA
jgi:hypothetical protein